MDLQRALSLTVAAALVLALSSPLTGCASSTTISSEPEGASLKIDGQPVGNTPVSFTENTVWVWTDHQITLERKGYHSYNGLMQATISPAHLVVGVLCMFPLLPLAFVGQFKPRYHYVLMQKTVGAVGADFSEMASIDFAE